jgi:hypothetical protein
VDFEKAMHFWQLDMWNGFFPAKWLLLRHQWEMSLPIQVRYGIQKMVQNKPLLKNSFNYTIFKVLALVDWHVQWLNFIIFLYFL